MKNYVTIKEVLPQRINVGNRVGYLYSFEESMHAPEWFVGLINTGVKPETMTLSGLPDARFANSRRNIRKEAIS